MSVLSYLESLAGDRLHLPSEKKKKKKKKKKVQDAVDKLASLSTDAGHR
jgi:hypothetical protein